MPGFPTGTVEDVDISEFLFEDDNTDTDDDDTDDQDKDEGDKPDDDEGSTDGDSNDLDDDSDDEDSDSDDDDKKKDDDAKPSITDETEIEVEEDGEKVSVAQLKQNWIDRREQHADYTRKTQDLADRRREFEAQEQSYVDRVQKIMTDPKEFLNTFRRKNPQVFHEAVTMYATEYQEMQELAKENPAAYQEFVQRQQAEFAKQNQAEETERLTQRETRRIRGLFDDHLKPALSKAGILPDKHSKVYEQFAVQRYLDASAAYRKDHPNERISKDLIYRVAASLSKDQDIARELEIEKVRAEQGKKKKDGKKDGKKPDKQKPRLTNLSKGDGSKRREKQERTVTHENYFDKFAF